MTTERAEASAALRTILDQVAAGFDLADESFAVLDELVEKAAANIAALPSSPTAIIEERPDIGENLGRILRSARSGAAAEGARVIRAADLTTALNRMLGIWPWTGR
jgi:hypothetical protein